MFSPNLFLHDPPPNMHFCCRSIHNKKDPWPILTTLVPVFEDESGYLQTFLIIDILKATSRSPPQKKKWFHDKNILLMLKNLGKIDRSEQTAIMYY